jgi:succinoglycan biosynthesis protein ExoA
MRDRESGGKNRVSVLVPVLNEVEHIAETAAAMRAQTFDGEIELLFIDGGSTDGTREALARIEHDDERVLALDNAAGSIPAALNIGLRRASGAYVARMDAHTFYPADYLERGIDRLRRGDVVWVSGPALPFGTDPMSRRVALALGTWLGVGAAEFRREAPEEFESDTGFTGVWRRETLERHGGWDESSLVNEDAELAARVREAGERIVCVPEMAARYVPRNSLRALAQQYWRYGQYRARTSRLHPAALRPSNLLPPALAITLLTAVTVKGRPAGIARAGIISYLTALAAASVKAARLGGASDALWLPAVFIAMHLPWGLGFLVGSLRFGPPLAALRHVAASGRVSRP